MKLNVPINVRVLVMLSQNVPTPTSHTLKSNESSYSTNIIFSGFMSQWATPKFYM